MTFDVAAIAERAGRSPGDLTRRDVARALLSVPASDALDALPALRRALIAAGNSFSPAFWDSAEQTLRLIDAGSATVGDVRMWLESTGTEPSTLVGMHVWDDEPDRTPLAQELHGLLVAHLEEQVALGRIDPDHLVAADREALRDYASLQDRWLQTPLADGRIPGDALIDEQDAALEEAWDAADAVALAELERILDEVGARPCPTEALRAACGRLRAELPLEAWPFDLLAAAGGVAPADLPDDDIELWLTLAVGTIDPADEPPETLPPEDLAAWYALQHVDWLAAVATLARLGPGAPADADDLAGYAAESEDVEVDYEDLDDVTVIAHGFVTVTALWRALGAVDDDERLTALGWWGLPEGLRRVWTPSEA